MSVHARHLLVAGLLFTSAGCGSSGESDAGCEITEVVQCFDYTVVYVKIDAARAGLPWALRLDGAHLIDHKSQKIPMVGIAPAGRIAFAIPQVNVLPGEGNEPLKYEMVADPNEYVQLVTPLERDVALGEIALSFTCAREDAEVLEMVVKEGKVIRLQLPDP